MNTNPVRRLPSADWIAFGVALAALCLHYVFPAVWGLLVLAVFAPSVLREIGVLRDADEWTRGIMHRAGFHGLLAVGGLLALNYLLVLVGWFEPTDALPVPFADETTRKAVVWVFLVSYLLQYWGAREGVFRILMAAAVVGLAPLFAAARHPDAVGTYLAGAGINAVVMVVPALLVRRRPRLGGGLLLFFLCVLVIFGATATDLPDGVTSSTVEAVRWGMVSVWLQAGLIFGITGVMLLRESE
jgi:hypothetical protein